MPTAARAPGLRDTSQGEESPNRELWNRYKSTGSLTARNRLVRYYMARHVRPIASRIRAGLPAQVDLEDLVQQGYFGLVDAMDRFDVSRDTRFETFSRRRISGAIRDYLREIDTAPRQARTRAKKIQAATERFWTRCGRPPESDELRELLDVPEAHFRRFMRDAHPPAQVPFSNVVPESGANDADADPMHSFEDHRESSPLRTLERSDLQRWLVRDFEPRDRLIVILYYYEQMTMREIGRALGISESRVSQRLSSILDCLRSQLTACGGDAELE